MWDPEPWLQLQLLALHKNVLQNKKGCCLISCKAKGKSCSRNQGSKWRGFPSMWNPGPFYCGGHFCARPRVAVVTPPPIYCLLRVLVVHYSLSFTAYKAASGEVFLRCGILSLSYNCNSWPCAKMVSTIKGLLPYKL